MSAFITWEELQQLLEQMEDTMPASGANRELPPLDQNADWQRLLGLADFLLAAVTDWPTYDLKEPAALVIALQQEVGDPLTYERLRQYASSLLLQDLWKGEAIGSLLLLLEQAPTHPVDSTRTLPIVLEQLTLHWRAALLS